ncbi:hypothetical protein GGR56DRAFT_666453 [Xylariaceae sp. FL0804]|nr:hypothetical protein GGR56DRAFT_666453 [Xylariaceae sp. FL0804]
MPQRFTYEPLRRRSLGLPPASMSGVEKSSKSFERCRRATQGLSLHWVFHAISLVSAVSLLVLVMYFADSSREAARCWSRQHYYSPVNDALATRPYITTRFNGSLWHESPFKGPPTPAVEEAWRSVMRYGMIAVTADDYARARGANHSTRTAARFPEAAGGGYVATTMGTHQLHCLHFVWQDHHRERLVPADSSVQGKAQAAAAGPGEEMYERHYEHCVDLIRQSLMCSFDTGLITYDWVRQHQNPTPNANAPHRCVDWDAAQAWLRERAVEVPEGFAWSQPEGQESLPWNP